MSVAWTCRFLACRECRLTRFRRQVGVKSSQVVVFQRFVHCRDNMASRQVVALESFIVGWLKASIIPGVWGVSLDFSQRSFSLPFTWGGAALAPGYGELGRWPRISMAANDAALVFDACGPSSHGYRHGPHYLMRGGEKRDGQFGRLDKGIRGAADQSPQDGECKRLRRRFSAVLLPQLVRLLKVIGFDAMRAGREVARSDTVIDRG